MLIMLSPPETEANKDDIWVGNSSSRLSTRGCEDVVEFSIHDMWIVPDRVFCAPADHCLEMISMLLPNEKVTILNELTDRSMGSLTGRTYRETMTEFPRRNWLSWQRSFWTAPPEGESLFDISDRILTAFINKILPIPSREDVLIVCAPNVMRVLIGFLTHLEETEVLKISIEPLVPYVVNGDIL